MIRRQPRSTRTDPLCPYPPLFQSRSAGTAISPMESDSMRVAVSAGEAAGIVETVPNGCGRTPGGGPGRTGQSVGASAVPAKPGRGRSEEHTSELQSLMRISYAVFCLKKKTATNTTDFHGPTH